MGINQIKTALVLLGTALSVFTQPVLPLIFVLIALMLLDYFTGIGKAFKNNTVSSKKSVVGIVKKLALLGYLACAFSIDLILYFILQYTGIDFTLKVCFGFLVIIWLMVNETISILENIVEITNVEIPFLEKALLKIKNTTEELAEDKEDGNEK